MLKPGNVPNYIKAVSQVVSSNTKPILPAAVLPKKDVGKTHLQFLTNYSLSKSLPTGNISIKTGPGVTTAVRYAHTDIQVPDYSEYRRSALSSPTAKNAESQGSRKSFNYLITGVGCVAATYCAKSVVTHFISSMSASADVLALAKIEIKLAEIPEGKSVTFKWRGKPLFIRHRTADEIKTEQAVNVSTLRDPEHDNDRVQRPEWLVVIGVCTHLGCVPIANAGDWGGYYCPCHGSHYDAAGRIRKGPAPLNLEVPIHTFPDEGTLVVG